MVQKSLPAGWEELDSSEYIDVDKFGKFADAWGRRGDDGEYDKIVAVHVHDMAKWNGRIYVIRNPPHGAGLVERVMSTLKRDAPSFKPMLSTHADEDHDGTDVEALNVKVGTKEAAVDRAMEYMD